MNLTRSNPGFEDVLECDMTNEDMMVNSILLFAETCGKNNEFIKAKCGLAAQGFSQQEGLSHFDTHAATPQDATWRCMMSLAASHNVEVLKQIDWTSDSDVGRRTQHSSCPSCKRPCTFGCRQGCVNAKGMLLLGSTLKFTRSAAVPCVD